MDDDPRMNVPGGARLVSPTCGPEEKEYSGLANISLLLFLLVLIFLGDVQVLWSARQPACRFVLVWRARAILLANLLRVLFQAAQSFLGRRLRPLNPFFTRTWFLALCGF